MRITYRSHDNRAYWARRWADLSVDEGMANRDSYPLKYAEMVVQTKEGATLEAGCGAGRILRHYHGRGHDIVGVDFIPTVLRKLRFADPTLKLQVGDVTRLAFRDGSFRRVLAFGLYHNLEHGLDQALRETARVLAPGGLLCASFRADNLQTRWSDWLEGRRGRKRGVRPQAAQKFHKLNLTRRECSRLLERADLQVRQIFAAQNMPALYKFRIFRAAGQRDFDESTARKDGYQLSPIGAWLQRNLMRLFPNQFCNLYVVIAQRPSFP